MECVQQRGYGPGAGLCVRSGRVSSRIQKKGTVCCPMRSRLDRNFSAVDPRSLRTSPPRLPGWLSLHRQARVCCSAPVKRPGAGEQEALETTHSPFFGCKGRAHSAASPPQRAAGSRLVGPGPYSLEARVLNKCVSATD
jgi:hypothetical protein